MMGSARNSARAFGKAATRPRLKDDATTCTWQSIMPGISVMPLASTTSASGTVSSSALMRVIIPSSINTFAAASRANDRVFKILQFLTTTGFIYKSRYSFNMQEIQHGELYRYNPNVRYRVSP
ncbi:hypothetical protein D3C71_1167040 [compost metagenome]